MNMEETIAGARERGVKLSVMIVADPPLADEEKEVLKANRDAAIALITGLASPEQFEAACQKSYALGIEHATEEFQSRAPVAAPAAPTPRQKTIDEVLADFALWQSSRPELWQWEIECMSSLREALSPGDTILPRFAYSCVIARTGGGEVEFVRRPDKRK
jgi:hypothetical protein